MPIHRVDSADTSSLLDIYATEASQTACQSIGYRTAAPNPVRPMP